MSLYHGLTATLLAFIAYTTNKQLTVSSKGTNLQVLDSQGKTVVEIPQVLFKPLTIESVFGQRISTIKGTSSYQQTSPDFEVEKSDFDLVLIALSFVPDANFKTKGQLRIEMNGGQIFPRIKSKKSFSDVGFFTDISSFSLPIPSEGLNFQRGQVIDVFIASSDGSPVFLTVAGMLGVNV